MLKKISACHNKDFAEFLNYRKCPIYFRQTLLKKMQEQHVAFAIKIKYNIVHSYKNKKLKKFCMISRSDIVFIIEGIYQIVGGRK